MKITFALLVLTCLAYQARAQNLNFNPLPESKPKMEILVAGSSSKSIESTFGHVALRLNYIDSDHQAHDYAISFVADTGQDEGTKKIMKGLVGKYNTVVLIEDFQLYLRRNVLSDDRYIKRFILNSNSETDGRVLQTLDQFGKGALSMGRYMFFTNNCANSLYAFLDQVGFFVSKELKSSLLPPTLYIQAIFNPLFLGIVELPKITSATSQMNSVLKRLGIVYSNNKIANPDRLFTESSKLTIREINVLLTFDLSQYEGLRKHILLELRKRPGLKRLSSLETFGVVEMPEWMYEICSSSPCAMRQAKGIKHFLGPEREKEIRWQLFINAQNSFALSFNREIVRSNQYIHGSLLLNELLILKGLKPLPYH